MSQKLFIRSIFSFALFSVLMFLYHSFFNVPAADDFSYAVVARNLGFFKTQIHYYFSWSARYCATVLLSLSPLVFNKVNLYWVLSPLSLCFFIYCFSVFSKSLFSYFQLKNEGLNHLLFVVIFLLVFFNECYSVVEFFYWYPGVVNYLMPTALICLLISSHLNDHKKRKASAIGYKMLLMFLISGFSETASLMFVIYHALYLCFIYYRDNRVDQFSLYLLFFAVANFSILYFCPGTAIRMGKFPEHATYKALTKPFEATIKNTFRSIKPSFFGLWLFVVVHLGGVRIKVSRRWAIAIFAFFCFCSYFPVAYSTGRGGPFRLHAMVYFFIMLGLLSFTTKNNFLVSKAKSLPRDKANLLMVVLLFIGFFLGNIRDLVVDISYSPKYYAEFASRVSEIERNPSQEVFEFPSYNRPAKSLFFTDIKSGQSSFTRYFNIKRVYIKDN